VIDPDILSKVVMVFDMVMMVMDGWMMSQKYVVRLDSIFGKLRYCSSVYSMYSSTLRQSERRPMPACHYSPHKQHDKSVFLSTQRERSRFIRSTLKRLFVNHASDTNGGLPPANHLATLWHIWFTIPDPLKFNGNDLNVFESRPRSRK
jgi:hypothetical protein